MVKNNGGLLNSSNYWLPSCYQTLCCQKAFAGWEPRTTFGMTVWRLKTSKGRWGMLNLGKKPGWLPMESLVPVTGE
jgi:hypothetical protein